MPAMALDSDLDFAFRLQLQEPITASQPTDVVSKHQTLKLNTHQTEIKDNVITEFETKRIKVSDDGASTSKTKEEEEEVFRVYFKGLVSEDVNRMMSKNMTLGGIGVAICDSKDVLVYDMKKDVEIGVGDRVSRRSVEEMALIHALSFAVSLGLKRIVLCFDHHTLYQYVSGRWQPKQHNTKSIVDQVSLIRKSFTHCEPSLVAQKDVKFALKFAREAINSQIEKAMESSRNKRETCVICLDEKSMGEFFLVEVCNHQYCYSCMKQHAEVKLLNGMVPKCPHEGCDTELRIERCQKFLTPKLTEMMKQQLKEASVPVTEKVYCPYPKCSTLMSKTELLQLPRFIYENGARTCHKCHGNFCVNCRVPWHTNMNCAEYKRRNPTPLVEESKLKNLAAKNLWRQCIKCKHMIELAAGCYHMTCRCGYEFCYTCGAEWKNKKATCSCPIWDEENIIDIEDEDDVEDLHHENDDDGMYDVEDLHNQNDDDGMYDYDDVEDLHNENDDDGIYHYDDVEDLHNENDDEMYADFFEDLHNENVDDGIVDVFEDLHNESVDDGIRDIFEDLHIENVDDGVVDIFEDLHDENVDDGNVDVFEDLHNENVDDENVDVFEDLYNENADDGINDIFEDLHNENVDDGIDGVFEDLHNENVDDGIDGVFEDLHNENVDDGMYDFDDLHNESVDDGMYDFDDLHNESVDDGMYDFDDLHNESVDDGMYDFDDDYYF